MANKYILGLTPTVPRTHGFSLTKNPPRRIVDLRRNHIETTSVAGPLDPKFAEKMIQNLRQNASFRSRFNEALVMGFVNELEKIGGFDLLVKICRSRTMTVR